MARGKKQQSERKYKNPNGFGSVYRLTDKRRSKPYVVRATLGWKTIKDIDGKPKKKQIYKNIGTAVSYEEGMAMLIEYHKNKELGLEIFKSSATFNDIYETALPRRLKNKSDNLAYVYSSAYKRLESIKELPISVIKTGTMQKCIDDVDNETKKRSTALKGNIKMVCKMVFDYAVQNDLVATNYADYLETGKIESMKPRLPFSDDEMKTLIKNKDKPYIDSVIFLICTGLRINEFCNLKKEDVNLKERYLITGSKTDAGKNRIVPIAHPIEDIVKQHIEDSNVYLFENDQGLKFREKDYRNDIFKPLMDFLGMNHLPHECRHTFSTITDEVDMNRVAQQKILGHKGKNVTERTYIHKNTKMLVNAIDKVWPTKDFI